MLPDWEIEQIRKIIKNSTPGPWELGEIANSVVSKTPPTDTDLDEQALEAQKERYGGYPIAENVMDNDKEFIIASKKYFIKLLHHVEEMEIAIDMLKEVLHASEDMIKVQDDERVQIRMDFLNDYSKIYAKLSDAIRQCERIEDN